MQGGIEHPAPPGRIRRKWRPSLALVLAMTLSAVLVIPFGGIVAVRYLFPLIGYRQSVLAVSLGILAVTAILGVVLMRLLLGPIRALADRAEEISRGDTAALGPLAHYGTREMERLGQSVLNMGRTLQGREAVLRSYADHATHELKSPLTVLRGAAELLDTEGLPAEDRERLLARIDEAADRMTALLDAQRALARAQNPMMAGRVRLSRLVPDLTRDHPDVALRLMSDADLPLSAEGMRLVLDHLIGNAARAGATEVRLTAGPDSLTVADNGPGISEGNRDRIFDPFFTTARDKGGTGMGLPIVRRMLEAHGAGIVLAEGGPGATFVIRF